MEAPCHDPQGASAFPERAENYDDTRKASARQRARLQLRAIAQKEAA